MSTTTVRTNRIEGPVEGIRNQWGRLESRPRDPNSSRFLKDETGAWRGILSPLFFTVLSLFSIPIILGMAAGGGRALVNELLKGLSRRISDRLSIATVKMADFLAASAGRPLVHGPSGENGLRRAYSAIFGVPESDIDLASLSDEMKMLASNWAHQNHPGLTVIDLNTPPPAAGRRFSPETAELLQALRREDTMLLPRRRLGRKDAADHQDQIARWLAGIVEEFGDEAKVVARPLGFQGTTADNMREFRKIIGG